jgi:hypothetical protein
MLLCFVYFDTFCPLVIPIEHPCYTISTFVPYDLDAPLTTSKNFQSPYFSSAPSYNLIGIDQATLAELYDLLSILRQRGDRSIFGSSAQMTSSRIARMVTN